MIFKFKPSLELLVVKLELELENQFKTSGEQPLRQSSIILGTCKERLKFFYLGPSNFADFELKLQVANL